MKVERDDGDPMFEDVEDDRQDPRVEILHRLDESADMGTRRSKQWL